MSATAAAGAGKSLPKADIASAVHEAAGELATRIPAARRCLTYSVAGAMVATEASGGRFVLQCGGYRFEDRPGVTASLGAVWTGRAPRGKLDLHCWFTEVPPGADPEDTWGNPPWLNVADLWIRHLGPVREAAGAPLARRLPDFVWGPAGRVRDVTGIEFRPDRPSVVRFLGMVLEGPDSDYWRMHLRVADQVACLAARKLGLRMTITADAVVPRSFASRWPAPDPGVT